MLTFKRLDECPINDIMQAWEEGFQGYFVSVAMPTDRFLARMAAEELPVSLSFVAYADGRPVAVVMNGVREYNGVKIAWNGGTGVSPEYRGKGVGKQIIEHALRLYREEGVHTATLEAISENEKAIRLYQSAGYEIVDRLPHMKHEGVLGVEGQNDAGGIEFIHAYPYDIKPYSGVVGLIPWQTQWSSYRKDGEVLLARENGKDIGFILYRRMIDASGANVGVAIGQCRVLEAREDSKAIMRSLIRRASKPDAAGYQRVVPIVPESNADFKSVLLDLGFKEALSQVFMTKPL